MLKSSGLLELWSPSISISCLSPTYFLCSSVVCDGFCVLWSRLEGQLRTSKGWSICRRGLGLKWSMGERSSMSKSALDWLNGALHNVDGSQPTGGSWAPWCVCWPALPDFPDLSSGCTSFRKLENGLSMIIWGQELGFVSGGIVWITYRPMEFDIG